MQFVLCLSEVRNCRLVILGCLFHDKSNRKCSISSECPIQNPLLNHTVDIIIGWYICWYYYCNRMLSFLAEEIANIKVYLIQFCAFLLFVYFAELLYKSNGMLKVVFDHFYDLWHSLNDQITAMIMFVIKHLILLFLK